jgi:hypothetical protein
VAKFARRRSCPARYGIEAGASDAASQKSVGEFYKQAIAADSIAHAIRYALDQPADVDVNQIVGGRPCRSFEGDWRSARGDAIVAAFAGDVWRGEKLPT